MHIPNTLFQIEYKLTLDLLQVEWPAYGSFSTPEFEYAMEHLLDTLRLYDIPRLLLDARSMATIPNTPDHLDLGIRFVQALETTRVRKVARLVADTASRDWQMRQLTGEKGISYQFQTFVRQDVALAWLKA